MIKFQATSLIHSISPVIQATERFQKRELVLNDSWTDRDGQPHPNFILVEFSGDRMAYLDNYAPGQRVTVEVVINGREGKNGGFFHSLRGLSIAPYQPQEQQTQGGFPQPQYPAQQQFPQGGFAAQPQSYPQQAPAYPQQGYQQPQYQQAPPQYQQPQQTYGQPGVENLPFSR